MSRYPKTGHFSEIREYVDFCNKNQKPVNLTHLRYLEMVAFKKIENHEHYTYYMVDLELQEFVNEMVMRIFKEKGTKLTQEDLEGIKKKVADKYSDF